MSREDSAEQIPYLSPATAPREDPTTSADDEDYGSLLRVKKLLDEAIDGLKHDFNVFDLQGASRVKIESEILGNQIAYDILVALQSTIDTAIKDVKNSRKA